MTSCPECASSAVEQLLSMRDDRQDDEHLVTVTKFRCQSCGCEFEVVERVEWETEITKRGLPEELSAEEFDDLVAESKTFEVGDEAKAKEYAAKHKGTVYTQVDAKSGIAYLKGFHLVNRNRYEVVIKVAEP